jgi:MFS family permease
MMRDVAMGAIGAIRSTWRAEMVEGWRYLLADPVLRGLLLLELVYAVFQMNPVVITIVARQVLDVGPEGLGGLLSATSVGAVAGTGILIALRGTERPGRSVTLAAIVCSAAMLGFAAASTYAWAFVALVVVGVFDAMVSVIRQSIAQLAAPARMRGRVIANTGTVVRGLGPLSQAQSGVAGGFVGGPLAVVVASAALAASAALVAIANRPLWGFISPRGSEGAEAAAGSHATTDRGPAPSAGTSRPSAP